MVSRFLPLRRAYASIGRLATKLKSSTEDLTGHSEVLQAQRLVRSKKEELRSWRQDLLEASSMYNEVQDKLKRLYARKTQVYQSQKRDVSALLAVNTEEEALLYDEQNLGERLEECQQKERQCFEGLSEAIHESHEKERAQSERMKYYSRLGSLVGAVFGFLGSNLFLRREVREHSRRQEEKMDHLVLTLGNNNRSSELRTTSPNNLQLQRLDRMTSEIQSQAKLLEEVHRQLKSHPDEEPARKTVSDSDVLVVGLTGFSVLAALLASYSYR